jgi:hypothetical protein
MFNIEILANDSRGVYIPQHFAEVCGEIWNIDENAQEVLMEGPDHEFYWDVWSEVLNNAEYTDEQGNTWRLFQNGDLFAYCEELMTEEERACMFNDAF